MKKAVLLILLFTSVSILSYAQPDEGNNKSSAIQFSVGPEAAFPIGNNVVEYRVVYGATAMGEYKFSPKFGVTLLAGYLDYNYKTVVSSGNQGFVPLLVGVKYYISPRAFVHVQAGAAFCVSSIVDASNAVLLNSGTFFEYAPGIGHKFGKKFEGEVKFFGVSNQQHNHINAFGLRLGYII